MEGKVKIITSIAAAALFVFSIWLVIMGQKTVGYVGIGKIFLGLAILLCLLWFYNSKHK